MTPWGVATSTESAFRGLVCTGLPGVRGWQDRVLRTLFRGKYPSPFRVDGDLAATGIAPSF